MNSSLFSSSQAKTYISIINIFFQLYAFCENVAGSF